MRKLGILSASVFVAATAMAQAQEPYSDPTFTVTTPQGVIVPVTIPAGALSGQSYTPTAQPIVVPVPISLQVTPNIIQQAVPVSIPAPTPVVVQPAPVIVQQPAPVFPPSPPQPQNQACVPIDGRSPLPFDIPTDPPEGPITSTVLTPPGYAALQQQQPMSPFAPAAQSGQVNPLTGGVAYAPQPPPQTQPQPQPQFQPQPQYYPQGQFAQYPAGMPYPAPQPAPAPEPLTVPAPGVPYTLDAQGRPHYVQQPGAYRRPGPDEWPGYTPLGYAPPLQPQPTFAQQPAPQFAPQQPYYQQDPQYQQYQQQYQQQIMAQQALQQQSAQPLLPVPPELNPNLNPNLTNPNTPVQLVTPAQVQQAMMQGAPMVVLDVRGELVRDVIGHMPNDVNVPLSPSESFPARVRHVLTNPSLPVVVYCNDGVSSAQAANMLANMGYRVFLMGIYTGWARHMPAQACTSCP